ncbi:MAG: hypothetical protein HQL80_02295 [Magnetococcales bacterium]|nr:hypothetical protein [Magnetococcales bacterium]
MLPTSPDPSRCARVADATRSALICRAVPLFTDGKADAAQSPTQAPSPEQEWLCCAACQHKITREHDKVSVQGKGEYTFFNPAGILFHIGCFREATGCVAWGVPSTTFSWFPGFAWQIACCSACGTHLGWLFTQGMETYFFGLVLAWLRRSSAASSNKC